jgi:hypothetical protein
MSKNVLDICRAHLEQKLPLKVVNEILNTYTDLNRKLPFVGISFNHYELLDECGIWRKCVSTVELNLGNCIRRGEIVIKTGSYYHDWLIFANDVPLTLEEMRRLTKKKYKNLKCADDFKVQLL